MMQIGGCGSLQGPVDQRHAILAAQPQIGQHQIDVVALQHAERPGDIRRHIDIEAILQRRAQPFAGVLFVIDDEDGGLHAGTTYRSQLAACGHFPAAEHAQMAARGWAGGW